MGTWFQGSDDLDYLFRKTELKKNFVIVKLYTNNIDSFQKLRRKTN
jgi:hypothetical protein